MLQGWEERKKAGVVLNGGQRWMNWIRSDDGRKEKKTEEGKKEKANNDYEASDSTRKLLTTECGCLHFEMHRLSAARCQPSRRQVPGARCQAQTKANADTCKQTSLTPVLVVQRPIPPSSGFQRPQRGVPCAVTRYNSPPQPTSAPKHSPFRHLAVPSPLCPGRSR